MHSTLIVARMHPDDADHVSRLFRDFDETDTPAIMGTRRRQLFHFRGLYFHVQDFDNDDGGTAIESAKTNPQFVQISGDLKAYIAAYAPAAWRSPKDAMATRFYDWNPAQDISDEL
jgi:cyclase